MTRVLKFRVWNEKEQVYCYFSEPDSCQCHHVWLNVEGGLSSGKHLNPNINQYHIEQYTGMKDSKSFEVYEGDILKIGPHDSISYAVIFWEAPSFKLRYISLVTGQPLVREICPKRMKKNEVVGTVRSTKDLLTYREHG